MYLVVVCPHCNRASAVNAKARTHTCPYCGRKNELVKYSVVARVRSRREARELVKRYNIHT